jgi:hypothetical protein
MSSSASDKSPGETTTLLARSSGAAQARGQGSSTLVRAASILIAFIALGAVFLTDEPASWFGGGTLPLDPREAAKVILSKAPVIVRSASPWTFAPQLIITFLTLPFPPSSSPSDYGRNFVFHERKDGHIDLAWLVRLEYGNNVTAVDLDKPTIGHVDVPRLREGHVGGFFWCVRLRVAV